MKILCIISCGNSKIWDNVPNAGPTPAEHVYTSPLSKKLKQYASKFYPSSWCILSAKYGFLFPDDIIPGLYNVTFNDKTSKPIGIDELILQVKDKKLDAYDKIIALGGKHYADIIKKVFLDKEIIVPLDECKGIGYMLGKLKEAIDKNTPIKYSDIDYFDNSWMGLKWTDWYKFKDWETVKSILPKTGGLYRIRPEEKDFLMYIGQTGRSFRERIKELLCDIDSKLMPYNDPHTATPNLWAWRKTDNFDYEFSCAEYKGDVKDRETMETVLLWKYRQIRGESTCCNHGRFNPYYSKSGSRKQGIRGILLKKEEQNKFKPSYKPLTDVCKPEDTNWMGLTWTDLKESSEIKNSKIPISAGVYKIFNEKKELLYIGETKKLKNRIMTHISKNWGENYILISYCVLDRDILSFQLKEIENDLIGSYCYNYSKNPKYQFGNEH